MERAPKVRLTKEFREVLEDVYRRVDLDSSGSLSRAEFNLFNWRTSGEEVRYVPYIFTSAPRLLTRSGAWWSRTFL